MIDIITTRKIIPSERLRHSVEGEVDGWIFPKIVDYGPIVIFFGIIITPSDVGITSLGTYYP